MCSEIHTKLKCNIYLSSLLKCRASGEQQTPHHIDLEKEEWTVSLVDRTVTTQLSFERLSFSRILHIRIQTANFMGKTQGCIQNSDINLYIYAQASQTHAETQNRRIRRTRTSTCTYPGQNHRVNLQGL